MEIPKAINSLNDLKTEMLFGKDESIDIKSKKVQLLYCQAVNNIDQAINNLELALLENDFVNQCP